MYTLVYTKSLYNFLIQKTHFLLIFLYVSVLYSSSVKLSYKLHIKKTCLNRTSKGPTFRFGIDRRLDCKG